MKARAIIEQVKKDDEERQRIMQERVDLIKKLNELDKEHYYQDTNPFGLRYAENGIYITKKWGELKIMVYEVWAKCMDGIFSYIDGEEFLGNFDTENKAIDHAKKFTSVEDIYDGDVLDYFKEEGGEFMLISVEAFNTDTLEAYTIWERVI